MPETAIRYEVVAIDWERQDVLETFDNRAEAERYAEALDGMALRCIVRPRLLGASRILEEQLRARVKEVGGTDEDADALFALALETGRKANEIARAESHRHQYRQKLSDTTYRRCSCGHVQRHVNGGWIDA
jgi:hypothetical protein